MDILLVREKEEQRLFKMFKRVFFSFFAKTLEIYSSFIYYIPYIIIPSHSHLKKKQLDFFCYNKIFILKKKIYFRVKTNPIWKAIWADNTSFDEVLISKRMVQDHMPDNVLLALTQVSTYYTIRISQNSFCSIIIINKHSFFLFRSHS